MRCKKFLSLLATTLFLLTFIASQASPDSIALKNGGMLRYITAGNGPTPIIFIHGYSFSADVWEKVLARLPNKYTAYAYDLRGFGDSFKPDKGYTFSDYVEDLAQFMDAKQISKSVLVGHSLGAIFLQDFAVAYPERVLALVLSNAQARHKDSGGRVPDAIAKRIASYGDREANRKIFEMSTPSYFMAGNLTEVDKKRFIETNLKSATPALKEAFEVIFTTPAIPPDRFTRIKAPTLVVTSTHDIVPFTVATALSEGIPHCQIFVVERSGHTPMWERPDRWCEGVFQFLNSAL
jgi:pimeloyl-ACP methyl ester carboxylesterase